MLAQVLYGPDQLGGVCAQQMHSRHLHWQMEVVQLQNQAGELCTLIYKNLPGGEVAHPDLIQVQACTPYRPAVRIDGYLATTTENNRVQLP